MKFGVLLADAPDEITSPAEWLSDCLEVTATAAGSGFDSIGVGQHFVAHPKLYLQPIPLLARLASETGPDVRLIVAILLLPILPPVEAAEQLATLDIICGGRLTVGIGAGYRDDEFRAFGIDIAERVKRQVEGLALMRQLWSGDTVNFSGRYFSVSGVRSGTLPLQRPGPPVWIAGSADGAVRRAARHADAWYGYTRADLDLIERQLLLYRATLAESGRPYPTELPMRREVFIAPTSAQAWQRAEALMAPRIALNDQWGVSRGLPPQSAKPQSFTDFARGRFIIGDPAECRREIERYRSRIGPVHMVIRLRWPGMSRHETLAALKLFGREVIAAFKPPAVQQTDASRRTAPKEVH